MGIDLGRNSQSPQLGGAPAPTPAQAPVSTGGGISLSKGAKLDLTKTNPGLDKVRVGLGWDVNANGGDSYDLDVEIFMCDVNGKVVSPGHFVFYNNPVSPDGGVTHNGDNRTGAGAGDDETISLTLSKIPTQVEKIIFAVTIDQAVTKHQNFGQVNNAYIHLVNEATGEELCRFDLSEDYSTSISMIMGEVYRHQGEFKFSAKGEGSTNDLAGLCLQYGAL